MSLRIAVIGKTGQLARALLREGEELGHEIIALDREALDLTAPAAEIELIHISTDYVFDGEADIPYQPDDDTDPLGVYGASKLDGELAILESGARALILRTSWLYDAEGRNFLTTMLKLAKEKDTIPVVDDQFGRPTYVGHLAQAIFRAADYFSQEPDMETGIYHVTNGGEDVSWAGFAKAIFKAKGIDVKVDDIPARLASRIARRSRSR